VYVVIHNDGPAADRLLRVETAVAESAEIHRTTFEAGVHRMAVVPSIEVPAGGRVAMEPGGYHVMLIGLRDALRAGDRFPVTLVFERAGRVRVETEVRQEYDSGVP
jgi:copper(I)-binding protein